jgi:crotonobetainyl-CoA:carnitine CoA-transferase CaiB-like acyl-CoA transferase
MDSLDAERRGCDGSDARAPRADGAGIDVAEAVKHPHLRQRGTIRKVHDRALGDFELPGFALRFSDFPHPLDLEAPFLGEHNEEIFAQYLGYDVDHIKELERMGIVRKE